MDLATATIISSNNVSRAADEDINNGTVISASQPPKQCPWTTEMMIEPQWLPSGEAETIRKVLLADQVQRHEQDLIQEVFNEHNFAAGVLNAMLVLVAYIFGNFPGHFWLLLMVPTNGAKNMYLAGLGVGCGPLLGATAAMPFVAMVFHDNKMITSLFIHLTPALHVGGYLSMARG